VCQGPEPAFKCIQSTSGQHLFQWRARTPCHALRPNPTERNKSTCAMFVQVPRLKLTPPIRRFLQMNWAPEELMGVQALPRQDVSEYRGFNTVSAHVDARLKDGSIVHVCVSRGEPAVWSAKA